MTNLEQLGKRWIELFDKKDLRGPMTMYSENCVNAQPHLPQPGGTIPASGKRVSLKGAEFIRIDSQGADR